MLLPATHSLQPFLFQRTPKPSESQIHPKDIPTKRELEVLQAVSEGFCTHEIASRLQITENTVETFRKRLIQKFEAKNAIDMVVKAMALGWIKVV